MVSCSNFQKIDYQEYKKISSLIANMNILAKDQNYCTKNIISLIEARKKQESKYLESNQAKEVFTLEISCQYDESISPVKHDFTASIDEIRYRVQFKLKDGKNNFLLNEELEESDYNNIYNDELIDYSAHIDMSRKNINFIAEEIYQSVKMYFLTIYENK